MQEPESTPPVFKKWRGWYWLLMIFLAVQVIVYYWLTASFA